MISSAGRAPPLQGGGSAVRSRHHPPLSRQLDFLSKCEVPKWVISSAGRAPPLQGGGRRFDPVITHHFGSLAQLVEQLTFNQLVAGSNPARPTNVKRRPKGAFLLCAELNDSTKLSGTILNNAAALARRASLRMRRVSLQQVRVERSETTEPLAATARRARRSRVILHDPPM